MASAAWRLRGIARTSELSGSAWRSLIATMAVLLAAISLAPVAASAPLASAYNYDVSEASGGTSGSMPATDRYEQDTGAETVLWRR